MAKHFTVLVTVKEVEDAFTRTDRYGKPEAEMPRVVRDVAHVVTSADTEDAALRKVQNIVDTLRRASFPSAASE